MRVSLNWLAEYVDTGDLPAADIAASLTDIGLEIEGIELQSAIPPQVVVGEILTAVPHPNADNLRLCTVNTGDGEPLPIVCGAPNARPGLKVAVATVGAELPGDFKIKKTKIRGETSCGMLCSEQELGLGGGHEGIMELPADSRVGAPLSRALGLDDAVFEVNVTPNRADCLGVLGIARDLAARLRKTLRPPQNETVLTDSYKTSDKVRIRIADQDQCGRFVALAVKGVRTIPSPAWMQSRLTAAGMRPLNLIVDATNYAMLEYAQPVHAYDVRHIRGGIIEVRPARPGETLTTLDGSNRTLAEGDLLICDGEGPMGLAGIMGGQNSEVRDDTSEIIIEVAHFNPRQIRKTARRLGLHTEASHRFERGTDIDSLHRVALRVADLIVRGAHEARTGGQNVPVPVVSAHAVDEYPADASKRVVALRLSQARQVLAMPALTRDTVIEILERLEFETLEATEERFVFEIPFFRQDIEREIDLIEEVSRIIGYDRIPYQLPVMNIRPTPESPLIDFLEHVRTAAAAAGLRETETFPFLSDREVAALRLGEHHPLRPALALANPLSDEHYLMQTTLVPGLLRAVAANRRQGQRGVKLFEVGRGYFRKLNPAALALIWKGITRPSRHLGSRAQQDADRPVERNWIAGILDQPWQEAGWNGPEVAAGFYHAKGIVQGWLRAFAVPDAVWTRPDPEDLPFLNPNCAAVIRIAGKVAGWCGELHPKTAKAMDLDGNSEPVVFELDLDIIQEQAGAGLRQTAGTRKFPPVSRDIALMVDQGRSHQEFADCIRKFAGRKHLSDYRLFDVYQGTNLPQGKKSMAYTLYFQSAERTLTDQEVDQEINALVTWMGRELGAEQR